MGHQFSYYLTPVDMRAAMERIRRCGNFVILHSRSREPRPRIVSTIEIEEDGRPCYFFWLVRTEDVHSIRMSEVPAQHYWSIDDLRSPVIELHACYFDGKYLRKSRLYYNNGYFDNRRQYVTKPDPFLKWGKCVFANMKRTLKRDASRDLYLGPDTLCWVEKGGILLGDFEEIPGTAGSE